jgi:hypothetical protein
MYEMLSNRPTSVSAVVEKFVSPISLDTVKVAVDAAVVVKLQDGEQYRSIVVHRSEPEERLGNSPAGLNQRRSEKWREKDVGRDYVGDGRLRN